MIFLLQLGLKPGNPLQTSQCYFLAFSLDFCSKIIASKTKWQQFYLHNFLIFCYNLPFKHTFLCEIDWKIWSKLSIFQILVINWLNFEIKQKKTQCNFGSKMAKTQILTSFMSKSRILKALSKFFRQFCYRNWYD